MGIQEKMKPFRTKVSKAEYLSGHNSSAPLSPKDGGMRTLSRESIRELPQSPGVYIFKDAAGKILYIGKAGNLKKRVQSYFTRFLSDKTQALVSRISDIEYILTHSESQAQLKEAQLIKENLPKYNVLLRDDKSFPLIRITDEAFPVVSVVRKKKRSPDDPNRYYGPFTTAWPVHETVKALRRVFGFRTCRKMPKAPCLYYRVGLCPAPCAGLISQKAYHEIIGYIVLFLEGKQDILLSKLLKEMREHAAHKRYEEAAAVRDQIESLAAVRREPDEEEFASGLEELQQKLHLPKLPLRIEAIDISNISGQEACGSLVSFYRGRPDKSNYRRFKIKEVRGIDDYAMISEVVKRRYARLRDEKKLFPDLILIDGGRQHLLTAKRQLDALGIEIPVISLAKEKEQVYSLESPYPLRLAHDAKALRVLQRVRDEAHRFAVKYHHVLRRKKTFGS